MMLVRLVSVFEIFLGEQEILTHPRISGSAIPGFNNSWIAHKGILAPAEKALYVSTSDGAGTRHKPL